MTQSLTQTLHRQSPTHPVGWLVGGLHDVPRFPGERILKRSILHSGVRGGEDRPSWCRTGWCDRRNNCCWSSFHTPSLEPSPGPGSCFSESAESFRNCPTSSCQADESWENQRIDYPDMQHLKTPPFSRHSLANLLYSAFRQFSQHFVSSALPSIPGMKETKSKP